MIKNLLSIIFFIFLGFLFLEISLRGVGFFLSASQSQSFDFFFKKITQKTNNNPRLGRINNCRA